MTQLERRIEKLEKELQLGPPTYEERQLTARLVAARRRLALHRGEPVPVEAEPQEISRAVLHGSDLAVRLLMARERRRLTQLAEREDAVYAPGPVSGGSQ